MTAREEEIASALPTKLDELPRLRGFRLRGIQMTRLETFIDAAFAFGVGCFYRLGLCLDVPSPMARRTGSESPGALPCSSRVCVRPTAIVKRSVKRLFNTSSAHDPISRATEICETIS